MKKTLIQFVIVCALIVAPYAILGAPKTKTKEVADHQRIENIIETLQKVVDTQNEQQAYIQVLWARTNELHEQILKLQGDPGDHDKARVYRLEGEMNMVDARVAQLERPEVEDEAK